ncbi:hypothetical protein [Salininema proteolyticum]|uniref:Tn3 transposase DDE domain-containing protein n=1 Tax=Salininema proteolyticum TaxID=1607685 RepID=A0ABV8U037_9ACTN
MTFGEDASQVRIGHAPENMAALRNFAIYLLSLLGYDTIPAAIEHVGAKPHVTPINLLGLGRLKQIVHPI